jgi:cysteine synthase A
MRALGATVHVVTDPDPATGDLLVARLALVDHLVRSTPGAFRPDQYANPANPAAHAAGTMREIDDALHGDVDVVFVATSTTGTLAGCCALLRDRSRATSVVAVDAVGSVLFGGARGPRLLPGFGAGIETPLSRAAGVHDVVRVSDIDCVVGCRRLVAREAVFAGASSGGVVTAFERTIDELPTGSRCVLIFHDGGAGYLETVYDDAWVQRELAVDPVQLERMVTRANRAC